MFFMLILPDEVPDICGFLDNKKKVCDNDPETNPFDDVRHYAYEGDGNTTGSLSSLASGELCFCWAESLHFLYFVVIFHVQFLVSFFFVLLMSSYTWLNHLVMG